MSHGSSRYFSSSRVVHCSNRCSDDRCNHFAVITVAATVAATANVTHQAPAIVIDFVLQSLVQSSPKSVARTAYMTRSIGCNSSR